MILEKTPHHSMIIVMYIVQNIVVQLNVCGES